MIKLSLRLQALAERVPDGATVADVGTDHGYLPVWLVQSGRCPKAIAADINRRPLMAAEKSAADYGLTDKIETRLGDGLAVLTPGEAACVTIAGMGGPLMIHILDSQPAVVSGLQRLILQPNVAAHLLRRWAADHGWQIADEDLVWEDGRYYVILALTPGARERLTAVQALIGPVLLARKHPMLPDYLRSMRAADQAIMDKLSNSQSQAAREKKAALAEKWRNIEEVFQCQYHAKL